MNFWKGSAASVIHQISPTPDQKAKNSDHRSASNQSDNDEEDEEKLLDALIQREMGSDQ